MNPHKKVILSVKGNKEEVLKALKNMIELVEEQVGTNEHTIKGSIWAWKDNIFCTTANIKIL